MGIPLAYALARIYTLRTRATDVTGAAQPATVPANTFGYHFGGIVEPTIRAIAGAIVLVAPAIMVVRQVQRASIRGTAVQLSRTQFADLYASVDDFAATLGVEPTPALSRLREYSCDRNGAALEPKGEPGLILLTAGRYAAENPCWVCRPCTDCRSR